MTDATLQLLETALRLDGCRVSVRAEGAIAEIVGPLELRRGAEWLTLGAESGSHVHLKTAGIAALRFAAPPDGNTALEVLSPSGERLCRISFARTNPSKEHDGARRDELRRLFGHLEAAHGE
jgi:hypothetical protein